MDVAAAGQGATRENAGSASSDPAPTWKNSLKAKQFWGWFGFIATCPPHVGNNTLGAFNGLCFEGCQSASEGQILVAFSKFQQNKLRLGKGQSPDPLPRGVAKSSLEQGQT